jgi:protein-disulfide isomerase
LSASIIRFARWARGALLALGVLLLLAPAAPGQARREPAREGSDALTTKVAELENKVALLESEVTLLRDRLEALLGKEPGAQVQEVPVGDSPVRGNPQASITLVMFGDYQSDYTARAQYVVKRLLEAYPQRVRFVYKHYPLTQAHPLASEAALAALAAERQGLFWEYHDRLFDNARRLDPTVLLVLAEQTGLDLTRFDRDRRSLWALERLQTDEKLAAALGVAGLPTLYLNGRPLTTWRWDYLKSQIDQTAR